MLDLDRAYRGKTVLVTGDTGFKGSWLAIWLRELGATVVGYALPPVSARDNFVIAGVADRITHRDGDVRDYALLASTIETHQPEIIFHLAAQALVLSSYSDPRTTFDTNVMGVVNLLEATRHAASVKAVVIVTSDKCYENHETGRAYRESDPLGGSDPYSASKGAAEIIVSSMRRSYFSRPGVAGVASARAGNVIGGGDWSSNRIVPDCMRALATDAPIVVRNPASIRPWQHVLDALHGYLVLGAKLCVDGARFDSAWNFGPDAGDVLPVQDLVEAMIATWGKGSYRIDIDPTAGKEAALLSLDCSKARDLLRWSPRLPFARAVAMAVEGYRIELEDPREVHTHRVEQIRAFQDLG